MTEGVVVASDSAEGRDTREVTEQLVRLARLIQVARSRFVLSPGQERDRAAYLVLQALDRFGPVRQRTLAERLRADPSTLSRQVTFLVERELVRRRADDSDGRACVLELTDRGAEKVTQLRQLREREVGGLLAGWTPAERAVFGRLMERFVDELGSHLDSPHAV